jgi:hypothetical protein
MNEQETMEVVRLLGSAFPSWNVSADTIEVYAIAFNDVPYDVVRKACTQWILTEEFPPTVAGIRKQCSSLMGLSPMLSLDAWGEVIGQVEKVGHRGPTRFSDDDTIGLTRKVVEAIGWGNICFSTNIETVRAQFLRLYDEGRKAVSNEILTNFNVYNALSEARQQANKEIAPARNEIN